MWARACVSLFDKIKIGLDGVYTARKEINEKLAEIFAGLIELCHFAENYAEFYQDFIKSDFES